MVTVRAKQFRRIGKLVVNGQLCLLLSCNGQSSSTCVGFLLATQTALTTLNKFFPLST